MKTVASGQGDPVTRAVAEFSAGLEFDDLPASVVSSMKLHIVDTLGCAVAGQNLDIAQGARAVAAQMGAGLCPVFGSPSGFGSLAATFANSVIANVLDYDDGFEVNGKGLGHPSASILPAAMAATAGRRLDGRRFLTALAAAFEINNRLILAMQPTKARFREVYGVAQHQAIGAAIAYGRLINLGAAGIANAIGLAGALTPLPSLHKYNWNRRPIISLKDVVAPAAQAGVQAVLMAEAGFVGSSDILDGDDGYWRMIGSDRFVPSILLEGYFEQWFSERGSFKLYPACRWLASALEAFEVAFERSRLDADAIAAVRVTTFGQVAAQMMVTRPLNPIDAQFSLPYLIAALAMRLPRGAAWFSPAALTCPRLRAVSEQVQVEVDPDMDRDMTEETRRPSARVTILDIRGGETSHFVRTPLGGEARPVDDETVIRKAIVNLTPFCRSPEQLVDRLLDLDREDDVDGLLRLFVNGEAAIEA